MTQIEPWFGFSKVGYLQTLANTYGDFKVARAWRADDGEIYWTKHYSVLECWHSEEGLKFLETVNNRGGLTCELRLDIDAGDRTPEVVRKQFDDGCDKLEGYHIPYLGFTSGSRGYHIHVFILELAKNPIMLRQAKENIISGLGGELLKINESPMLTLEFATNNKTGKPKLPLRGGQIWLDVEK